jgi:hypothetical protein
MRRSLMFFGALTGALACFQAAAQTVAQAVAQTAVAQTDVPALSQERFTGYVGQASDKASGKLLYQERHYIKSVNNREQERVVLYSCPNGNAFARKLLRSGGGNVPEFELLDARTGYREGLKRESAGLRVYFQLSSKKAERSDVVAADAARLVADAGFDSFVRGNWDALLAKNSVPLNFIVPGQLDYIGFKLNWQKREQIEGRAAEVFKLAPSGVIGWFVSGIDVSYASDTRQLRRFSGLSNMRDLAGKNYTVNIIFPAASLNVATSAAEFSGAKTQALVGSCAN